MGKVIEIEYSELKNLGDYQHRRIGARAAVGEDEEPEDAMKHLRNFVWKEFEKARCTFSYDEDAGQPI
ncbi:MAG TPA: hypothetical protein ENO07_00490 [candidate division Zixibacteria bacterium]|nr:hypothetical protein [candidate division Zixibacteria bacterium]